MASSTTEHTQNKPQPNLLQEFDNSLPDFRNLDEYQHLRFVKAIRLLCEYFNVSEARLQKGSLV